MRFDPVNFPSFVIGYTSQVTVGHRARTDGSEEAVMVWWLLIDRCLAGRHMAVDKCEDGEQSDGSKRSFEFACFFSATGPHSSQTQSFKFFQKRSSRRYEQKAATTRVRRQCRVVISCLACRLGSEGNKSPSLLSCHLLSLALTHQWAERGRITRWIKPLSKLCVGQPHTTYLFPSPTL